MYRTSFRTTDTGLSLWPQPGTAAAKTRFPLLVRQPVMMMMKHELQSSPRRNSSVCFSLLTLVTAGHWSRQVLTGACKLVQTSAKHTCTVSKRTYTHCRESQIIQIFPARFAGN